MEIKKSFFIYEQNLLLYELVYKKIDLIQFGHDLFTQSIVYYFALLLKS